jgi:hypothetical protein
MDTLFGPITTDHRLIILIGVGFGIVISYQSGSGWLGTLIWPLISAVILGGAFYFDRVIR